MQSTQFFKAPHVVLVDDDAGLAASLKFLLQAEKTAFVHCASGAEFLEQIKAGAEWTEGPGCVLLDVRMPNENGIQVFESLKARSPDFPLPVIFMTGHGDVPLVTKVLKEGAFDFIQKPMDGEQLLQRLDDYFRESDRRWQQVNETQRIVGRIATLTERERAVMLQLYQGQSNKDIAEALGNSIRTIELRRATIYDKMGVKNTVEMARLLQSIGWEGDASPGPG